MRVEGNNHEQASECDVFFLFVRKQKKNFISPFSPVNLRLSVEGGFQSNVLKTGKKKNNSKKKQKKGGEVKSTRYRLIMRRLKRTQ